jgi:hypothetical protein
VNIFQTTKLEDNYMNGFFEHLNTVKEKLITMIANGDCEPKLEEVRAFAEEYIKQINEKNPDDISRMYADIKLKNINDRFSHAIGSNPINELESENRFGLPIGMFNSMFPQNKLPEYQYSLSQKKATLLPKNLDKTYKPKSFDGFKKRLAKIAEEGWDENLVVQVICRDKKDPDDKISIVIKKRFLPYEGRMESWEEMMKRVGETPLFQDQDGEEYTAPQAILEHFDDKASTVEVHKYNYKCGSLNENLEQLFPSPKDVERDMDFLLDLAENGYAYSEYLMKEVSTVFKLALGSSTYGLASNESPDALSEWITKGDGLESPEYQEMRDFNKVLVKEANDNFENLSFESFMKKIKPVLDKPGKQKQETIKKAFDLLNATQQFFVASTCPNVSSINLTRNLTSMNSDDICKLLKNNVVKEGLKYDSSLSLQNDSLKYH